MASRLPYRVALAAALATGALARAWNLLDQVPGEDELHAVRAALGHPLGELWRSFPQHGDSLLLTVLDRLWIDAGQTLTEVVLRLPVLVCGLVLLWWLPRVVARRLGDGVALALAWLLALSPLLVLSSRVARAEAPLPLFGALAAVAFLRWWLCGNRLAAALYVLFAALTVSFSVLAAPFVLAPWLFAAGDLCVRPRTSARPKWRQVFVVSGATVVALAALLLPARASLAALFAAPGGAAAPTADTLAGLVGWWSGAQQAVLVLLFGAAALVGLCLLWMRQRRVAVFSLVLVATPVLSGLTGLAAAPSRALIVVLPVVLLWVAVALAEPWRRWPARGVRQVSSAACSAFVLALLIAGPLADPARCLGAFPFDDDPQGPGPFPAPTLQVLPDFYRALSGPGPIVETPWPMSAACVRSLRLVECDQGQRVLVLLDDETLVDLRLQFRNALQSPEQALASPARWLVLHSARAVAGELSAGGECYVQWDSAADLRSRLVAKWGQPDVVEQSLVAWDLARVRAATIAR